MDGDYTPMLAEDFQSFIKIRDDAAEFFSERRGDSPVPLPSILIEGKFLDGYVIKFDGHDCDVAARLEDVYVRFELIDLA